ncbi:Na+/H+ antiporter NhaA type [Liberibacter crescens BT-1]|uniref:Na(+)/H(+) antiporter NhaA n=2 Tax=Liberibacter crescens TaxID=1273132 RepID=L0EUZ6_LIBCB|nr:Na+/H+ antiporter NhaA type [Liberibacter crescens BT-1]
MVVFFLSIGLEIKREILEGELSNWKKRILPGYAAIGGMIVPALIYLYFNINAPVSLLKGWAIPTTTDIAFTLGVLSIIGSRIPSSLKVFLTALTILDDVGAVIIIACFYTKNLNFFMLGGAIFIVAVLYLFNLYSVTRFYAYGLIGLVLCFFIGQAGIHTTIAGIIVAMSIPFKSHSDSISHESFYRLEKRLKPWITFIILPMFVFANAGIPLYDASFLTLTDPVTLGVMFGLFAGKQIGIFLFSFIIIRIGWANLPEKSTWLLLYGISVLCGTGFTMSLFITLQAFPDSLILQNKIKIGIILASITSIILSAVILRLSKNREETPKTIQKAS